MVDDYLEILRSSLSLRPRILVQTGDRIAWTLPLPYLLIIDSDECRLLISNSVCKIRWVVEAWSDGWPYIVNNAKGKAQPVTGYGVPKGGVEV